MHTNDFNMIDGPNRARLFPSGVPASANMLNAVNHRLLR